MQEPVQIDRERTSVQFAVATALQKCVALERPANALDTTSQLVRNNFNFAINVLHSVVVLKFLINFYVIERPVSGGDFSKND